MANNIWDEYPNALMSTLLSLFLQNIPLSAYTGDILHVDACHHAVEAYAVCLRE